MIDRTAFLGLMAQHRTDEVVVHTMGTCNDWPVLSPSPLNFFVSGAMGFASSVGLGLAESQPERTIWIFDGDGSLLMNLQTLVTIAERQPANLVHFVLQNGLYELVGKIEVPGNRRDLSQIAAAAGFLRCYRFSDIADLETSLPALAEGAGPTFVSLDIAPAPPAAMQAKRVMEGATKEVEDLVAALAAAPASTR